MTFGNVDLVVGFQNDVRPLVAVANGGQIDGEDLARLTSRNISANHKDLCRIGIGRKSARPVQQLRDVFATRVMNGSRATDAGTENVNIPATGNGHLAMNIFDRHMCGHGNPLTHVGDRAAFREHLSISPEVNPAVWIHLGASWEIGAMFDMDFENVGEYDCVVGGNRGNWFGRSFSGGGRRRFVSRRATAGGKEHKADKPGQRRD